MCNEHTITRYYTSEHMNKHMFIHTFTTMSRMNNHITGMHMPSCKIQCKVCSIIVAFRSFNDLEWFHLHFSIFPKSCIISIADNKPIACCVRNPDSYNSLLLPPTVITYSNNINCSCQTNQFVMAQMNYIAQ